MRYLRARRKPIGALMIALMAFGQISPPLQAATLLWNPNGDAGATGGSGTWIAGSGPWHNSGAALWSNTSPDDAVFGGTGGGAFMVTLGGAVTAGSVQFSSAGYTIDTSTFGLTLNSGITANEDASIQSGSGGSIILGANNTWSVAAAKTLTITSSISGTGFGFTKSGDGTVVLSGANTFTGQVTLDAGTLRATSSANVLGTGTATLVLNGGRLELANDGNLTFGRNTTMSGNVTLVVDTVTTTSASQTNTLGTLTTTTDLTLNTLRGANITGSLNAQTTFGATTLGGNLTITQGTRSIVQFGAMSESGSARSLTVGDGVTGNGSSSIVILNGTGSWTGGTVLNSGTLRANAANSLGASGSLTTVNGGTLDLRNASSAAVRDITFAGTGTLALTNNSSTTFNIGTLTQNAGALTITAQRASSGTGNITHILNEAFTLNGNLVLNAANSTSPQVTTLRVQGAISDGIGINNLTKTGAGVVIVEAAADYDGLTDIDNGTLRIGVATALPSGAGKGDLTFSPDVVTDTATLDVNGFNQTINGLSTSGANLGTSIIDNTAVGAVTLTIGGNDGVGTFTGVIQDTGGNVSLTKIGSGLITLAGVNTYAGATSVDGGALVISSGALANTSGVTVGANGNGILAFGDGLGDLTTLATHVNLSLGGASTFGNLAFQLGSSTSNSDRILLQGSGTLTVAAGGGFISGVNLGTFAAGAYDLITGPNAVVGFGNLGLGSLPGGFTYTLTNTGGSLETVTLTAVAAPGGDVFWTGDSITGANTSWSTLAGDDSNWATDLGGTEAGFTPGSANTVNFSATTSGNFSTTLDNNYSVVGINILSGGAAVTINPGVLGTLTIGTGGIDVQAGAPVTTTISAPIVLGGVQTWNVADSGSVLIIGGSVSGGQPNSDQTTLAANTSLTITGAGSVTMGSAANTFTGDIVVNGGGYNVNDLSDWGGPTVASSTSKTITLINGGRLNIISGTLNPGALTTTPYDLVQIGSNGGTINVASGAQLWLDDVGQLYGTGNLTKTGEGTLRLRNQTAYDGIIDITAGVLQTSGATGGFGTATFGTTIRSGAALDLNDQAATDAETVTIYGTGLAAAPAGAITNSAVGSASFSGSIVLGSNSTIGAASTGSLTLSGVISGAFDLTVNNVGTAATILTGLNDYTGATVVSAGLLRSSTTITNFDGGAASWLGASSNAAANLLLDGGTLFFDGATGGTTDRLFTLGAGGGGVTNDAASNGTLSFTNTGSIVASGTGDRTLKLTANGTGTFTFTPSIVNPTSGKTSLDVVIASTAIMLLNGANSTHGGDSTLTAAAGGVLRVNSTKGLGTGTWTLGTGSILDYMLITNATAATYTGNLLIGDNNVTLRVSNPTSAGGQTATIGAVTLGVGTVTFARGSNMSTNNSGSIVTGTTTLTGSPTINLAAGSGSAAPLLTLGSLNDGGFARTITIIGAASGTGDQFLRLNQAAIGFTAGTNIVYSGGNVGGIRLDNATAFGTATNYGTITFTTPATSGGLQLRNNAATNFRTNLVFGDNDVRVELGGTSSTQSTKTHTAGTLSIGTAMLTLIGNLSTATDNVHSLTLLGTSFTGDSTFNVSNVNGTAVGRLTLGTLDDGGVARSITKTGNGALTLSSAATSMIAGTTLTATAGLVELGNATALGAGTLVLGDGTSSAQLQVLTGTNVSSTTIVAYAGGWSTLGEGAVSGPTTGTGTISSTININNTVLAGAGHFGGGGGTLVIAGAIVAGGTSGGEVVIRNGNVRLGQAVGNVYTQLTVSEGTTSLGVTNGIKTAADVRVAALGDATIDLNGFDQTVDGTWTLGGTATSQSRVATVSTGSNTLFLNGTLANSVDSTATQFITGKIDLNGGSRTFNIDNGALTSDMTVNASVSNGSISKTGAGILTLAGANNLGAGSNVNVSGGTLIGGFGTSGTETITVGSSGSLQFVNGTTDVLTLGSLAGALTLGTGARLGFELGAGNINPASSLNDRLIIGAGGTAITVSGNITLDFYNLGLSAGTHTYDLIKADSGLNLATYVVGNAPLGFNYTLTQTDTLVQLVTEAIIARYWRGDVDSSWSTTTGGTDTNWSSTPDGATDPLAVPGATETVIFSADNATGPTITTTLDAAFTIEGMQFVSAPIGVTAVTINDSASSSLTLTPPTSSAGISVADNAGTITFGSGLPVTVGSNQTWTVSSTGAALVMDATLTFTGSVTKAGAGTLTLSGPNTGSGGVILSAGTLNLNSAAALGTGALTINASTTINTTAGALTLNNNLQTWNGSFTFTGTNNLNIGTGAVTMGNNAGITITANELIVGGIIGDSGNNYLLTKLGAGVLTLSGANTFGGGVRLNDGTLNINHASALGSGTFIVNGGVIDNTSGAGITLSTDNVQEWNADFTFTGSNNLNLGDGAVTFGSGTGTVRIVTVAAGVLTVNGGIGDGATATGLTKVGAGTLTLGGANTFSGNTTVSGGTLNITGSLAGSGTTSSGSTLSFGPAAAVSIVNISGDIADYFTYLGATNAGATAVYNQTGGTVNFTSTSTGDSVNLLVNSTGYGYMNITGGTTNTLGRVNFSRGGGTGVVYVGGTGTLNLKGEWAMITYGNAGGRGSMTVGPGGTVDRGGASTVMGIFMNQANQYGVLNITGGSFLTTTKGIQFGNGNGGTNNIGFFNLAAGIYETGANFSQSVGTSTGQQAYINLAGGTLRAVGALTAALPNNNAGQTVITTLFGAIDNTGATGDASQDFTGGLTVDTNNFAVSLTNPLLAATGDGVAQSSLSIANSGSGYVGAPLVQFTGGTLVAGGTPAAGYALIDAVTGTVTGIVITSPGTYSSAPTITLTGGGGTGASVTVGALVANTSGGLTKIGEGTLTLSGINTYTGGTIINGGTLALGGSTGTILDDGGAVTINSGASFDINTRTETVGLVTLNDGSITGTTGVLTGAGYEFKKGSVSAILGGTGGLTKTTGDTVALSGTNTFTGAVNVNGGVLAFSASANLGDESAVTNTIGLGGGTLQYTGSTALDLGINRVVTVNSGTSTVEVTSATGILTVSGGISNASTGNLIKSGAGILEVTNNVTVDLNGGTVNVGDGVLRAGLTDISILAVAGTGTLELKDNAGVALTLGATLGALTLNDGAVLRLELGNASNFDSITVASGGTAVTNGTVTLNFLDLGGIVANTYNLIVADSGLNGATFVVGTAPPGFSYSISQTASLVSLTTTAYTPRYWTGSESSSSWATINGSGPFTSNWSSTADGLTNAGAIPGAADTVIFSASAVLGSPTVITTTLDAAFTVDSLQFLAAPAGVTAVNINNSAGSSLELKPAGTTGGIFVDDNAGIVTLGAGLPVTVSNPQNWGVTGKGANGSELIINADVAFNAAVNKTRTGALTLSGTNTGTGAISLLAGQINLNSATALGAGTFTIANLTTIDNTSVGGAITLTNNNAQNWNGSFAFAGTNDLNMGSGNVTLGTNVTITTTAGNLTIGGAIGDGANSYLLTKAGAGTLTLAGASTHDGGVELDAGQLNINSAGALGNGTFTINGGTIDNSSGGAIVSTQNNAQTWNAGFTFVGSNDLGLGTGTVTMGADITVITTAGTLAIGGIDDGANSFDLTKQGAGTLLLDGASTYDGGNTNIDDGTLMISVNNALPTGTIVRLGTGSTAATLDLNGFDQTIGGLLVQTNSPTATNNIVIDSGKTLTVNGGVTLGVNANASTTNVTFSGGGSFIVNSGGANFQVGGATTTDRENAVTADMTGLTTFTADLGTGIFRVGDNASGSPVNTSFSVLKLATNNTITASSFRVGDATSTSDTGENQVVFGSGTNVVNADTINIGMAGANVRAGGKLLFDGSDSTGTLKIRASDGTGRALFNMINSTGSTANSQTASVDFTGHSADILLSTLTMASRTTNSGSATAIFTFDQGTFDVSDVIMAQRTLVGTGNATATLNLGDSVAVGTPTVTIGTLAMAVNTSAGGISTAMLNVSGGNVGIGSINMANASAGRSAVSVINLTGGTITLGGDIVRTGGLGLEDATVKLDGGTLDMGGNSIGAAGVTGKITFTAQQGTLKNLNQLNGGDTLTKTSTGVLIMDTANSYTGQTVISAGVVAISHGGALGGTANGTSVEGGGTLSMSGDITVAAEELSLVAGAAGSATLNNQSGDNVWTGNLTVDTGSDAANRVILNSDAGKLTVSGSINLSTGTQDFVLRGDGDGELSGQITGSQRLFKSSVGTGTWTLSGDNSSTFTGRTTISNGAIQINSESNLGAAPGTYVANQLTLGGGSTNGRLKTLMTMFLSANRGVTLAAGGGTFETAVSTVLTVQSVITGGGGLSKEGGGTLVLAGANDYSGTTTVSAGTLQVGDGAGGSLSGAGEVNVSGTGSKLSGAGSITGGTVIGSGAILAPGLGDTDGSNETLNFTAVTVEEGGQIQLSITSRTEQLGASDMSALVEALAGGTFSDIKTLLGANLDAYKSSAAGDHDFIHITGAFSVDPDSPTALFKVVNRTGAPYTTASPAIGDVFNLMDWSGMLGFANTSSSSLTEADFDFAGFTGEFRFDFSAFETHGILVVVPEPSRALFLMLGLLGLLLRRHRW